ncbi:hypothetical protein K490DRAFT_56175 [Saccharata proteae CBS 121410]|uniref:Uncharacterized protein n=1 Tax=Saccharata proteae CBS 121410 TaxID=1314787 RepID=A0A9P4HWL0_9PEZI|nr:hypothetical protein K490DRAFT_56175 [Saccharata proteae CBS 121410]
MNVPTVTEEDLRAFHAKHFPGAPPPTSFFSASVPSFSTQDLGSYDTQDCGWEEEYEEDDGLGYYPDGVKRTLTDEQIAIFRHSEIQALLREKRLREEDESPPPVTPAVETIEVEATAASKAASTSGKTTSVGSVSRAGSTPSAPDNQNRKRKSKDADRNDTKLQSHHSPRTWVSPKSNLRRIFPKCVKDDEVTRPFRLEYDPYDTNNSPSGGKKYSVHTSRTSEKGSGLASRCRDHLSQCRR